MLNILIKFDIFRILLNFGGRELNYVFVTLSVFVIYVITYFLTEMSLILSVWIRLFAL